ncbi:hypothetical protein Leryth_019086 [Lithospermum erythrorhizon]|nr:hypothetical protein Leryth_019086 [Lithospermum erythrorhizon]
MQLKVKFLAPRNQARQGVRYVSLEGLDVVDTQNMSPVLRRRVQQMGEIQVLYKNAANEMIPQEP